MILSPKTDTDLLGDAAMEAVRTYATMSRQLPAPESFIRDSLSLILHRENNLTVSVELPIRKFLNEWKIDKLRFEGLSNFRIDIAVYEDQSRTSSIDLDFLIELKLWTDRYKVASDVMRLKKICSAVDAVEGEESHHKTKGYAIVCPQYIQGHDAVTSALNDFADRFPIRYFRIEKFSLPSGRDFGVGVAIIDVDDFIEDHHG